MRASHRARYAVLALALGTVGAITPRDAEARRGPAPGVIAAPTNWLGVYRLTLAASNEAPTPLRLIVEREGNGVSGTLITEGQGPAHADVRMVDDALMATARTSRGVGELVLRLTTDGVTGTFTVGKRVWNVTGTRTT